MLLIVAAIVAVAFALWIRSRIKRFSCLQELGIPGPKPSLLFGNLSEMSKKTPLICFKEWSKKYGKVFGYYLGTTPVVVVSEAELLKKIQISDFPNFSNRSLCYLLRGGVPRKGDGFSCQMTLLRDKKWKVIRSLLTPSFTSSKLKLMTSSVNEAVDVFIEKIDEKAEKNEDFDIYEFYKGLTADVTSRIAFGVETDIQNHPNGLLFSALRAVFGGKVATTIAMLAFSFPEMGYFWNVVVQLRLLVKFRGMDYRRELVSFVGEMIKDRRSNPSNRRSDLLQVMIDANISQEKISRVNVSDLTVQYDREETESVAGKGEPLNFQKAHQYMADYEIVDNAVLFFISGSETTSVGLAFVTHFLIHYPDVQEKVRKEVNDLMEREGELNYGSMGKLQYLNQVISESLRVYPPVYFAVCRETKEDVTLGNLTLKKGMCVQIPPHLTHHDEDYWSEPEKFDPDRFSPENKATINPLAFQAFGNGPRNCVGMRFALMEISLIIARLLHKYRLLPCSKTDKLELPLKTATVTMTPRNGIHLRVVRI